MDPEPPGVEVGLRREALARPVGERIARRRGSARGVPEPGLLPAGAVSSELRCGCRAPFETRAAGDADTQAPERAALERLEEDASGEVLGIAHIAVAVAEIGHAVEDPGLPREETAREVAGDLEADV